MDAHSIARITTNVVNAAAPALATGATIPVWGPSAVELFGVNIPIASMFLSMVGLGMARGVSAAREGVQPGGRYLTGVLVLILFAIVIERRPGPGIAIAYGIGVGASGIVAFDLIKDRFMAWFGGILNAAFGKKPGGGDAA